MVKRFAMMMFAVTLMLIGVNARAGLIVTTGSPGIQPTGCVMTKAGLGGACVVEPQWDGLSGGLLTFGAPVTQTIYVQGGTPPYSFWWDSGADGTSPNLINKGYGAVGPTQVMVTENGPSLCPGCSFTVTQNPTNNPNLCYGWSACSTMTFDYAILPGTYYPWAAVVDSANNTGWLLPSNDPYHPWDDLGTVLMPVNVPAMDFEPSQFGQAPYMDVQWLMYAWNGSYWAYEQLSNVTPTTPIAFQGFVSGSPNQGTGGCGAPYYFYWNTGENWVYNGSLSAPNYNGLYLNQLQTTYGSTWYAPVATVFHPQLVVKDNCGYVVSSAPSDLSMISLTTGPASSAGGPFSTPPYGSGMPVGVESYQPEVVTVPGVGTETIDWWNYGLLGPWLSLTKSGTIYASTLATTTQGAVKKPVYGKSSDFNLGYPLYFPDFPYQWDVLTSGVVVNLPYYPGAAAGSTNMPNANASISLPLGTSTYPDGAVLGPTGCQPLPYSITIGILTPNPYDTNANCMHDIFLQESGENNVSIQPWDGQGMSMSSPFDPGMQVGISTVEGPQTGWVEQFNVEPIIMDVTMNPASTTEPPYTVDTYMYGPYYEPLAKYIPFVTVELGSSTKLGASPGFSSSDSGAPAWTIGGLSAPETQCDASIGTMLGTQVSPSSNAATANVISAPYGLFQWTYFNVLDGLGADQNTLPVISGGTGMVAGNCELAILGAPIGSLAKSRVSRTRALKGDRTDDAPAVKGGTMTVREENFLSHMTAKERNRAGDAFNVIWATLAGKRPNLNDAWMDADSSIIETGVTAHDFTKPWELSYVVDYDVDRTTLRAADIADKLDDVKVMRPLIVRGWKRTGYAGAGMPAPRDEGDQYTYREN